MRRPLSAGPRPRRFPGSSKSVIFHSGERGLCTGNRATHRMPPKGRARIMKRSKPTKANKPPIKALTIRQPWAELILRGRKPFELRTWRTKYRGPLVIHAAAKVDAWDARHFGLNPEKLITSAFVGFVILSDVRPYTREDARLLKKRRAGYGWFPSNTKSTCRSPRLGVRRTGKRSVPSSTDLAFSTRVCRQTSMSACSKESFINQPRALPVPRPPA